MAGTTTAMSRGSTAAATLSAVNRADSLLNRCLEEVRLLPGSVAVEALSNFSERLEAERILTAAREIGTTGDRRVDQRKARDVLRSEHTSAKTLNRDARRVAAIAASEHLATGVADGSVGTPVIDGLLVAADTETGELPMDLIETVVGLPPDQAARVADEYVAKQADPLDVEDTYQQQMANRRAVRYKVPPGGGRPAMAGIGIEGPDAVIDELWAIVTAGANAKYQADGGRERPVGEHQPFPNRGFDAVASMLRGDSVSGGGGAARPAVVVTFDGNALVNDDAAPVTATQLGTGPISGGLLNEYLARGSLSVLVQGLNGEPLWFGRARRRASASQFLALAVRDKGCVLCRAGLDRCDAHHLTPWSAPGRGQTDIDQLALLCQRCHHDLHQRNHTLYWRHLVDGCRIWETRPATADETPAMVSGPETPGRRSRRGPPRSRTPTTTARTRPSRPTPAHHRSPRQPWPGS